MHELTLPVNSVTMRRMPKYMIMVAVALWSVVSVGPAAAVLRVAATIFPIADLVRQVGQEHVQVITLLPPGASPHTFEPTPAQIREVAQASVFVCVGAGLDTWAAKLLAARSQRITVLTLTEGVQLLSASEHLAAAGGGDPHIWLDPVLVRDSVVPRIVETLSQADPAARAAFTANGTQFRDALTALDAEIRARLAPVTHRSYVALHAAWHYFGQRYDLHEAAVVEAFPGKEPSAREIAAVVEQARAAAARVVLIEPQINPRTAQQIAREFDAQTVLVDPIGGANVAGRSTYLELMRYNLQVLSEALR